MEKSSDKTKENQNKPKKGPGWSGIVNHSRKGGLNRAGTKNKTTIAREQVLEHLKQTISDRAKKLIDIQTILANGGIKVFKIEYYYEMVGKTSVKKAKKPELVVTDDEIANALDFEFGDGDSPSDDQAFYFVITKDPDNQAINSLLDRAFGKATEFKKVGLDIGDVDEETKELARQAWGSYVKGKKGN